MPDPNRSKTNEPQAETIERAIDEFSHPLRSPSPEARPRVEAGRREAQRGAKRDSSGTSD